MDSFSIVFLSAILILAASIDFRKRKIPNLITFPSMAIAVCYHVAMRGAEGLCFSLGGLALGIGIFLVPYLMGGMGAGDAKLMGAIGALVGARGVFYVFLCTAIVGGVYALFIILIYRSNFRGFFKKQMTTLWAFILTRKYIPDPIEEINSRPRLCYGLAIALGTGLYIFLNQSGHQIINQL
jgi:prepilin peptidase CpaA